MSELAAMGVILLAMLGIGAMLYLPIRWLALRSAPSNHKSRQVVRTRMLATVLRFAGIYVFISAVAGALLLLGVWPWHPTSAVGWIAFFTFALPITAIGEWLGSLILKNRFAASLGRNTSPHSVSWSRIAYGVAAYLVLFALVGAAYISLASG